MPSASSDIIMSGDVRRLTAENAVSAFEVRQLADGRAGIRGNSTGALSGADVNFRTDGQYTFAKTTGVVFLDGGKAWLDRSASQATFRRVNDQDFDLGSFVGDALTGASSCVVNLNKSPVYTSDLARDPFITAIIGTQALGGLALNRRGGAHNFVISSANEAQKLDALAKDGFVTAANAIVEFAFAVPDDGSGTAVDVSIGIASGTHATDADSIAQHLLMHLDANNTAIRFQSKDGTTTVASTDSTKVYTLGALNRVEVWFDMRNPADVQIYVDGVLILPVFNVNAASSVWYLLAHLEKTSSTDTYEFDLDWMRARYAEQ